MRREISVLTSLRGIAAINIVIFHLIITLPNLNTYILTYTAILKKSYLWVDFFFLMSGFVVYHVYAEYFISIFSWKKFRQFLVSRLARLYPLHLLTLWTLILIEITQTNPLKQTNHLFAEPNTLLAILTQLSLLESFNLHAALTWNIVTWSVSAEWYTYILFPLMLFLFKKNLNTYTIVLIIIIGIGALFQLEKQHAALDITFEFGVLRCIPSFLIGICVYILRQRIGYFASTSFPLLIAFSLPMISMSLAFYDTFSVLGFAFLLFVAADNQSTFGRFLEHRLFKSIGEWSYSIYMLHFPLYLVFAYICGHYLNTTVYGNTVNLLSSLFICIIFLIIVLVFSALSFYFVEMPSRNYIRKIFYES